MRTLRPTFLLISALAADCLRSEVLYEPNVTVRTISGSGFKGLVDGRGIETMFHFPSAMAADRKGNLVIYDQGNRRLRMLDTNLTLKTLFPERRTIGPSGGSFRVPVAINEAGEIFFSESRRLFKVGEADFEFFAEFPSSIDELAIAQGFYCTSGNQLWKRASASTESFQVFASSGNATSIDGVGIFSSFKSPAAICLTPAEDVIIGESTKIRWLNRLGILSTIAGTSNSAGHRDGETNTALFYTPRSLAFDASDGSVVFVSGDAVRRLANGRVTTIAGSSGPNESGAFADGPGDKARFFSPEAILIRNGAILVLDTLNNRLREITIGNRNTHAPPPVISADVFTGITIVGIAGRSYRIEAKTDVDSTDNWFEVETVTLPQNTHIWFDRSVSAKMGRRFYRATLIP